MYSLQHEWLREIVAVRKLEQARPQVVVLTLEKRRVVSQPVCVEHVPVDQHGRMEERRAEQRLPAERTRSSRHHVRAPTPPALVEVDHGRADCGDRGLHAQPLDLALEPGVQRDVVRVEPRNVSTVGRFEPAVERRRQPEQRLVAENGQPAVRETSEHVRGRVRRRIVDRDQFEIVERLAEHALDRLADEGCVVVDGHQHGHERHGR